jgi:L-seryl-tRNA(Ser) seleniumtransferase
VNILSSLPSVDSLLTQSKELVHTYGHSEVASHLRLIIADIRQDVLVNELTDLPSSESIIKATSDQLRKRHSSSLKKVFNLTGTVLHTNLGRAELPQTAIEAIATVAGNYSNLEFNIEAGKRGDRDSHIESIILAITGAEAATVVNNNAAAVLLTLNTLAHNLEVPVSRGELVEIGGSFRIPEVMERSGCKLVEVGATNRTHIKDFKNAITDKTALLMKVHTSNYEIQGFTSNVSDEELATLAHEAGLSFITDLGSGTLVDLTKWGLPYEPTVQATLKAGADLITFSGDKLLGGPQCGIIVGKKALVERIKQNPMKRALRVDKLTIAALFEVLKLYLNPDDLDKTLPALKHLSRPAEEIKLMALSIKNALQQDRIESSAASLVSIAEIEVIECESQIGSGSLPTNLLPSYALSIRPISSSDSDLVKLAKLFRDLPIPVIGRINDGAVCFDLRTLESTEIFLQQIENMTI